MLDILVREFILSHTIPPLKLPRSLSSALFYISSFVSCHSLGLKYSSLYCVMGHSSLFLNGSAVLGNLATNLWYPDLLPFCHLHNCAALLVYTFPLSECKFPDSLGHSSVCILGSCMCWGYRYGCLSAHDFVPLCSVAHVHCLEYYLLLMPVCLVRSYLPAPIELFLSLWCLLWTILITW